MSTTTTRGRGYAPAVPPTEGRPGNRGGTGTGERNSYVTSKSFRTTEATE